MKKKPKPPPAPPPESKSAALLDHEKHEASRDLTKRVLMDPNTALWGIHVDDHELDPKLNANFLDLVHPRKHWLVLRDFPELAPAPQKPPPTMPVKATERPKVEPNTDRAVKKRQSLFGQSVGAIIRWMSCDGWSVAAATRALNALGCTPAPDTVRWNLTCGKARTHGEPAELTAAQMNILRTAAEED